MDNNNQEPRPDSQSSPHDQGAQIPDDIARSDASIDQAEPPKKVALVVEDDLISRELHMNLLNEIGFKHAVNAIDGMRALSVIKEQTMLGNSISLILCDWNMPNMSGLELLEIIRNDEALKHIPFFLITSNHNKAHIVKAIKTGVTDYLAKPVSKALLTQKLSPYAD